MLLGTQAIRDHFFKGSLNRKCLFIHLSLVHASVLCPDVKVVRGEPLQWAPFSRRAWKQFFLFTDSFAGCVMAIFTWAAGRDLLPGLQCRRSFIGQLLCLVIWCPGSIATDSFIWVCAGLYWEHMDGSPECLCRVVRWGSWSQCFGVIRLERGLGKGKGTTCSCVMKRAQVGSCPLDLSSIQVSGFNPSYWMALGSSSWVLYFCSWKQSSEASGTLCGLSTGSYTEARLSNEINGNP